MQLPLQNAFWCSEREVVSAIPRERVGCVEVPHCSTYLVCWAVSFPGLRTLDRESRKLFGVQKSGAGKLEIRLFAYQILHFANWSDLLREFPRGLALSDSTRRAFAARKNAVR